MSAWSVVTWMMMALPPGGDVDAGLRLKVNRAIPAGVTYLKEQEIPRTTRLAPYPLGASCLKLYALLVCGVDKRDPLVEELREVAVAASRQVDHTYTLSLALLGLLAADRHAHAATISHLVTRIESGQILQSNSGGAGAWTYAVPRSRTGDDPAPQPTAHWVLPDDWWDDSNTQYAVLALRAAADFGFEVDERVFERAAEHFVDRRNADGGFSYSRTMRPTSYVSMTAGALGSLVMCADMLDDSTRSTATRRRAESLVQAGQRWLSRRTLFPATDSPWPFYSAYAIERFGHYADVERIGKRDWYAEGAAWLVAIQRGDGSWSSQRLDSTPPRREDRVFIDTIADYGPTVDTCFALLFLKRSSFVHTQVSDEVTILLKSIDPQFREEDLARVEQRILKVGAYSIPQLVKGLYLPVRAAREVAARCLRQLTGEDMGFLEATDEASQRRAREAWVRYLYEHPELRDDGGDGD